MSEIARIVQFPHPGPEHAPPGDLMMWNTSPGHKRKYLVSPGKTVDMSGATTGEGELLFWGEWEPPSYIAHRWTRMAELPTVVHEPYWTSPGPPAGRQNTDPWVFGREFLYSNCKQATHTGGATALQELPAGSVILFGSTLARRFVLDTVFVIAEVICRWSPADDPSVGGAAFRECTVRSLASSELHATSTFTLYRGATPEQPVEGMFSWVPCQRRTERGWPRFPRPSIVLMGIVNPRSQRSPSGAKIARPGDQVRQAWQAVAAQAEMQGLSLGCGIRTPQRRKDPGGTDGDGSASCSVPSRTRVSASRC